MNLRCNSINLVSISLLVSLGFPLSIFSSPHLPNFLGSSFESEVLSQTVGDLKAEADQLLQQGIRHIKSHQFNDGIRLYQQALAIYQKLGDYESQAEVLALLGYISSFQENYPVAINYLERALKLAREIPNRYLEGNILFNLGGAYIFQKDITRGKEYLQQSLDIAREINDRDLLKVHEQIWQSLTGTVPDSNISSTQSRQHQTLSQNLNSSRLVEAGSLNDQGIELGNAGQFEQAQHFFEKALTIYREIDNQQMESRVLGNIGLLYFSQGYFDQAIDYYNKSLLIARKAQDYQWEAAILTHLGTVNFERGNYAQAIDYQMQSLLIAQKLGDKELEARIQDQLGSIYLNLGEYFKAVEYQLSSLVIIQDLKNAPDLNTRIEARRYEAGYLGNLANTFKNLGEYVKAEEYAQQSLQIAREINNPVIESKALGTLSNISIGKGNYDVAKEYAQQKLTITLRINDRQGQFEALNSLGNSYFFLKDYSTAIKYFQESLNLSQEIGDIYKKGWTLTKLGDAFLKYGNFEESEKFLRLGMEAREALRGKVGSNDAYKVSIFDLQVDTYQLLQQALVAQNKTDEALEIAERGRARAFVELLSRRLSPNQTEASPITAPKLEEIKQIAKTQNATLVEYSVIKDKNNTKLYIWVIQSTGKVEFRRVKITKSLNKSLETLVTYARNYMGVRGRGSIEVVPLDDSEAKNQLKQLHKLLIEPIADVLPTDPNAHVIFMPQGELFLVPFPALQDENGKYLIEKHTILTAPAIQVLDLTQKQRVKVQQANPKGLVVVGNPTMPKVTVKIGEPPKKLPLLPASENEAITIAKLLNTKALTGNQATKTAILSQLPQARIIHLATHGLLDDFKGLGVPGAIALAPSGNDNGLLTADEILDLKLNAELVVLSACDTGRGRITGDGVIGLSRSLITAGVPSIIVSLWSVPDAPTASLMTEFYRNWQEKKLDKAQALRQAMLTTMKNHPNPKDWAAFTLIGEAE
ncbi:CHAT domain-containing protein [Microcystis aeruginosa]|uniref:CHAT domain-containing protein n=1 Tax=Microcystis aeruginosa TaxID=1126 RepID=UPI00232F917E|nr:CHAT domain-containing protein [Microcystis aeruginosa]MDB9432360.1 CHAT domain-containing protein [Microcystis aeruginosa CS-552/01]